MGTSNMFDGKNDKHSSLLPEDYLIDDETPIESWKSVKSYVSKNINDDSYGSKETAIRKYLRASGGTKTIVQNRSGKVAAKSIGLLMHNIETNGYFYAFGQLGVDCTNKSIEEIFSELIPAIVPDSKTKEDGCARQATQEALSVLYDYVVDNNLDLRCLDNIPEELIQFVISEFITAYLWSLFLSDMSIRFEKYQSDGDVSFEKQEEYKSIIHSVVDIEYNKHSLDGISTDKVVTVLMEKCYSMLEGVEL